MLYSQTLDPDDLVSRSCGQVSIVITCLAVVVMGEGG